MWNWLVSGLATGATAASPYSVRKASATVSKVSSNANGWLTLYTPPRTNTFTPPAPRERNEMSLTGQRIDWPAEVTNLSECHQPLFDLVDRIRVRGRKTARDLYGARGWVAHHTTDAWWFTVPIGQTVWGMWPLGGAWVSRHLFEHWRFTGDTGFLRERAFPVMREAALFFLDYLAEDPETGLLVSGPSTSPENVFITEGGQRADVGMGNAMDQQIIWDLFTNLLEAAEALGINGDEVVDQATVARDRLQEELERARAELDTARRAQNLARMSELQYGRIPELERQIEGAEDAEQGDDGRSVVGAARALRRSARPRRPASRHRRTPRRDRSCAGRARPGSRSAPRLPRSGCRRGLADRRLRT